MHIHRIALTVVVSLWATLAVAQEISPEQNKLLARRAAIADAYRKLAEAVYGLELNSTTRVRDFVTENDDIRGAVDEFVRGIRVGEPTFYEDGSCEVPAEVTVAKVIETLQSVHQRSYKGDSIKTSDFESITRKLDKKVIKVVGMGAPRPDLPPDLPEGVAEQLGPSPVPASKTLHIPEIWKRVGPQARLLAMEAARKDAQRRLAERIKGLRLTARTQVRDFAVESDVITTEMNAFLVGAHEIEGTMYLHDDELIAEVKFRVPTEQVVETIKSLHSRHYKGDDVKGTDVENIVRTVVKKDFDETGMGVPPPQFIKRAAEQSGSPAPDWVAQTIEAEGQGTDGEIDSPQGKLRAARAAELDAKRKLAETIAGLRVQSETTVKDFAAEHDTISTLVDAVLIDAVVTNTRFGDGTATVRVSVPGMRVWSVVNDELRRPRR